MCQTTFIKLVINLNYNKKLRSKCSRGCIEKSNEANPMTTVLLFLRCANLVAMQGRLPYGHHTLGTECVIVHSMVYKGRWSRIGFM